MTEETLKPIYRVISVEQVPAPEGMEGDWYRYVIERGSSTIEGMQAGKRNDVVEHAEQYAESLNTRFANGSYAYRSAAKKK